MIQPKVESLLYKSAGCSNINPTQHKNNKQLKLLTFILFRLIHYNDVKYLTKIIY